MGRGRLREGGDGEPIYTGSVRVFVSRGRMRVSFTAPGTGEVQGQGQCETDSACTPPRQPVHAGVYMSRAEVGV